MGMFETELLQIAVRLLRELNRKADKIMTQLSDLTDDLNAISTDVDQIVTDHTTLETELTALQTQLAAAGSTVDLTAAIATAASIRTRLEAISSAVTAAAPPTSDAPAGETTTNTSTGQPAPIPSASASDTAS